MGKTRVYGALLVLLGLLLWAAAAAGEGVTRCLLSGCDRFVRMPALLRDFLPGEPRITRKVNGPGSVGEFEALVDKAFAGASGEDTALVYLSTHGILRRGEEPERMTLLLSDGEREENLTPEELRRILDRVPGEKVLILDACHSGAVIGDGAGGPANRFADGPYRVLVSCAAREESWFWTSGEDGFTGTGYFTAAVNSALRASDPEQIDPDGGGQVTLAELAGRLREIHGASTVICWPAESGEPLFRLPEDRHAGNLLRGIAVGPAERDGDAITLPVRFRAEEPVRVMYQLAPSRQGRWDFEHAVRLPDREKTGLTRGLLSPGEKDRKIRLSAGSLGEDGRALMQILTLQGEEQTPTAEAGWVIIREPEEGGSLPEREEPGTE